MGKEETKEKEKAKDWDGPDLLDPTELYENPVRDDEDGFNELVEVMYWIIGHDYTNYVLLKTLLARLQRSVVHDIQESKEKCKHLWTLDG